MTTKDAPGQVARRAPMGVGVIAPILVPCARPSQADGAVVDQLLARSEAQARPSNVGETERWLEVADPGDNFTLMQPFGGAASQGFGRSS
jgi:hypothetical protein